MSKKKLDYYVVYDEAIEAHPKNQLRYLLIGMLVSAIVIGSLILLSLQFGLIVSKTSFRLESMIPPQFTYESPGIAFSDWPGNLRVRSVESLAISPDGHTLAVLMIVDGDYALQLREFDGEDVSRSILQTWTPVHTGVTRVRFSPNSKYLVLSGGSKIGWKRTEIRDATTGLLKFSLEGSEAVFSPDSRYMATTKWGSPASVYIWELFDSTVTGARLIQELHPPVQNVFEVAFSPDGRTLAAAPYYGSSSDLADKQVVVWDTHDWDIPPVSYPMLGDSLTYIAFTPDSQRIMATIRGGVQMFLLDEERYERRGIMDGIPEMIAISPDGKWMALGFNGLYPSTRYGNVYGPISLWSIADLTETRVMLGNTRDFPQLQDLVFIPNGDYLLSANSEKTIIQWDYLTGKEVARLRF